MFIFDLDGTLTNDTHRAHYRQQNPPDWDSYTDLCGEDTIIEATAHILDVLANPFDIEIWTGRPERVRDITEKWLRDNHIVYDKLRMRQDGDFRSAYTIKLEWLEELQEKPLAVFEDRDSQVQPWLDAGLTVYHIRRPE